MQYLLLYKPDSALFETTELTQVFRSDDAFKDVRFNTQGGDLIECEYVDADDRTLISLDHTRQAIYVGNTWGAALRAVLLIHKYLGMPLRIINDDYTFDLTLSEITSVEELETALNNAKIN